MKNTLLFSLFVLVVSFYALERTSAQDWKNVNPKMNNVLADTTWARAIEVTMEPGQKSEMHSHPAHFYYALTAGKIKVHYQDGSTEEFELTPGFAGLSGPERPHMTENVGDQAVKFLIVEMKEHPYDAKKMKK